MAVYPADSFPMHTRKLMPSRTPAPSHRHAAPMGPWPWVSPSDMYDDATIGSLDLTPLGSCNHGKCSDCKQWIGYPQSLFPNWTPPQVRSSGIAKAVTGKDGKGVSTIYTIDVLDTGAFKSEGRHDITKRNKRDFWTNVLQKPRPPGIRIRALFVDNMSPVLQMLGTVYEIEPFFFSSSLKWIPARYQENAIPKEGDHITITLTFLRSMDNPTISLPPSNASALTDSSTDSGIPRVAQENQVIDTQAPLILRSSDKILFLDLLAIHMVRGPNRSTIISHHPPPEYCTTSAKSLHNRVRSAGDSIYWQKIFKSSADPTFVLLAILYHALYSWDEALEALYAHFCWLESKVISTNNMLLTPELHIIRAHLLHYTSLLNNFRKSVEFILETTNPCMDSDSVDENDRTSSLQLLVKECNNLLSEIKRLDTSRDMLDKRLKNVMNLVFASVNIGDSKAMQKLTEAAVRDSTAMKQLSYLTMVFLPGTFVAGIFGMNVRELNDGTKGTLLYYMAMALPLTFISVWIVVAHQSQYYIQDPNPSMWKRLWWPVTFLTGLFSRNKRVKTEEKGEQLYAAFTS